VTGSIVVLEILVEEPSAKAALELLVPKIVPGTSFAIRDFDGKPNLLQRLPGILKSFAARLTWEDIRIVVVVDRDDDNCLQLKQMLSDCAAAAGLPMLCSPGPELPAEMTNSAPVSAVIRLTADDIGSVPSLGHGLPRLMLMTSAPVAAAHSIPAMIQDS